MSDTTKPTEWHPFPFAAQYGPAITVGLWFHLLFWLITATALDFGMSNLKFSVAMWVHWVAIVIIMEQRPLSPTINDVRFIRYGVLLLWFVAAWSPLLWEGLGIGPSQLGRWFGLAGPRSYQTKYILGAVCVSLDLAWLACRLLWKYRPDGTFGQGADKHETSVPDSGP